MAAENYSVLLKAITATEPTFNFSLRGYDRRQVDQYAQRTESQLATTLAENRELGKRLNAMVRELDAAQAELADLRQRPAIGESLSFKHLGLRVEQILTDAHEEAEFVRRSAAEEADQVRAEAAEQASRERTEAADEVARLRSEITEEVTTARTRLAEESTRQREQLTEELTLFREMQARVLGELDEARKATAAEEARVASDVARVESQVARVASEVERLRAEGEALTAAAQDEYERVTNSAMETAEKIHADLAVQTTALREQAYAEASSMTLAARTYAEQTMTEAHQHATAVRDLVQSYGARLEAIERPNLAPPADGDSDHHRAGRPGRELSATSMRALSDRPASDSTSA